MKFKSIGTKPMIYKLVASHWQIETKQTNTLNSIPSSNCSSYLPTLFQFYQRSA